MADPNGPGDPGCSIGGRSIRSGGAKMALRKLRMLDAAIRINDQWRICFRWHGDDAYDVEIVDYH
jgi:plasmid maintenance system killer protein